MKYLIFIILFLSTHASFGQKCGYIDYEQIKKIFPENEEIDSIIQQYVDTLQAMNDEYEIKINNFDCNSDTSTNKLGYELFQLQNKIVDYIDESKLKVRVKRNHTNEIIELKIKDAAEIFCKKSNLSFLTRRESILVGSGCKDYTEDFIRFIKTQ